MATKKGGWYKEPRRHGLAAKGIKTAVDNPKEKAMMKVKETKDKLLKKYEQLDSDYEKEAESLLGEARKLYKEEEELRKLSLSTGKNLARQRSYIYNKAMRKDDKAKMLEKLRLTSEQIKFIKTHLSELGKQTNIERIMGVTSRYYDVTIGKDKFKVTKDSLYGLRGSPKYTDIERVK